MRRATMKIAWLVGCLLVSSTVLAADNTHDPSLIGCWRGQTMRQELPSGLSLERKTDDNLLLIDAETITARSRSGRFGDTKYRYVIARPGVYRTVMIDHPNRKELIGMSNESEYRIKGDELSLKVNPQKATPKPVVNEVLVESKSVRYVTGCPIARP